MKCPKCNQELKKKHTFTPTADFKDKKVYFSRMECEYCYTKCTLKLTEEILFTDPKRGQGAYMMAKKFNIAREELIPTESVQTKQVSRKNKNLPRETQSISVDIKAATIQHEKNDG